MPHLIATKLMRPAPPPQVVARPRLDDLLDAAITRKLVLVSAPAGSGKSTLVADWLERARHPAAWLSIDAGDDEPARFLRYVVAAIRRAAPEVGAVAEDLLEANDAVAADVVLAGIVNDLADAGAPLILVLDDYHLITDARIHAAVGFLINHLPQGASVVLMARNDPPLPLARLRVAGGLAEIRADQLRFSRAEAGAFLNDRLHLALSPRALERLEQRTEGWVAGLQLAGISLDGVRDKEAFVERFAGTHRHLTDYLLAEVLARQPERVRRFLERTSVLERFTAPLCDAVCGMADGAATVRHLVDANLFVIALDDDGSWFRYHHLFADFLRHRLAAVEADGTCVSELHRRASAWFEANGWVDEAIDHALAGHDLERAARLVEGVAFSLQVSSANVQLARYVARLPTAMLTRSPKLGIYYGWALVNTGQATRLSALLPLVEQSAQHSDEPHVVQAGVLAFRAYERLWRMDFEGAVDLCRAALRVLDLTADDVGTDEERWSLTAATNVIPYTYLHADLAKADEAYPAARALSVRLGNRIGAANDFARHAWVAHELGRSAEALALVHQGLRVVETWRAEGGRAMNVGELHLELSRLLYERNELDEAERQLALGTGFAQRSQFPPVVALAHEIAFNLDLARGRFDAAERRLMSMGALLDAVNEGNQLHRERFGVALQRMRLRLVDTDARFGSHLDDVTAWIGARELWPDDDPIPYATEGGYTVLATLSVARGQTRAGVDLLDRLLAAARAAGRVRATVSYLAQRALAERHLQAPDRARATLREALALAEPRGYVRTFVDLGPAMRSLLGELRGDGAYVAGLLGAATAAGSTPHVPSGPGAATPELGEREVAILRLLAAGRSNKGIAKDLGLSPNTVKWYLKGLFEKLDATGRAQAVARANDLGWL